jgi:hypothetical protein
MADLGSTKIYGDLVVARDVRLSSNGSYYVGTNEVWHAGNLTSNSQLSNGAGYTTNVGDITNVSAGSGLSGGGSSGSVTLSLSGDSFSTSGTYTGVTVGNADTLDGWDSTSFMFSERGGDINSNITLDDESLYNGAYRVDSGLSSSPNNGSYYALLIYGNEANVVGQLATHYQTGETYTRSYNNSWSSWKQLYGTGDNVSFGTGTFSGTLTVSSDVFVGSNITLDASTGISKANDHQDPSDIRLKTNLVEHDPLDIAKHVTLYKYNKRGLSYAQYGIIAQDIMKYDSDLAVAYPDEEFGSIYSLSGYSIASIALSGVGKLDYKVEKQAKLISELETKIKALEKKLKNFE